MKITYLRQEAVAAEHVLAGRQRCRLSGVQAFGLLSDGVVDGHVESSAYSGALRINHTVAEERGNGCVHRITSFRHNVSSQ